MQIHSETPNWEQHRSEFELFDMKHNIQIKRMPYGGRVCVALRCDLLTTLLLCTATPTRRARRGRAGWRL